MRDWNNDGKEDVWDDIYYMENIDRYYNDSSGNASDYDLDDASDDDSVGYSYSRARSRKSNISSHYTSTSTNSYNPDGISDNVLAMIGAGAIGVPLSVIGFKLVASFSSGKLTSEFGAFMLFGGFIFDVFTIMYFSKLINVLFFKKHDDVYIVLTIVLTALLVIWFFWYAVFSR